MLIYKTPDLNPINDEYFEYLGHAICIDGIREFFELPLNSKQIHFEVHSSYTKYRVPFQVINRTMGKSHPSKTNIIEFYYDGCFVFDPCLDDIFQEWDGKIVYVECHYRR